jgi:ethanolamine ammonia-lyase large subunit
MGVPGADDVMLNYQSTSFHDALFVRRLLGLKHAPEFAVWLQRQGLVDGSGRLLPAAGRPALAAAFSPLLNGPVA